MERQHIFSRVTLCAATLLLACNSLAQQTPASNAPQAPASGSTAAPAAKTQKAPVAKPGTAASKTTAAPLALKTNKDKVSYAIGINIGKSMKKDSVDVEPNILLRGLKDGLSGSKPLLSDQEAQAAIVALQADMKKKAELVRAKQATPTKPQAMRSWLPTSPRKAYKSQRMGCNTKSLRKARAPSPRLQTPSPCSTKAPYSMARSSTAPTSADSLPPSRSARSLRVGRKPCS